MFILKIAAETTWQNPWSIICCSASCSRVRLLSMRADLTRISSSAWIVFANQAARLSEVISQEAGTEALSSSSIAGDQMSTSPFLSRCLMSRVEVTIVNWLLRPWINYQLNFREDIEKDHTMTEMSNHRLSFSIIYKVISVSSSYYPRFSFTVLAIKASANWSTHLNMLSLLKRYFSISFISLMLTIGKGSRK